MRKRPGNKVFNMINCKMSRTIPSTTAIPDSHPTKGDDTFQYPLPVTRLQLYETLEYHASHLPPVTFISCLERVEIERGLDLSGDTLLFPTSAEGPVPPLPSSPKQTEFIHRFAQTMGLEGVEQAKSIVHSFLKSISHPDGQPIIYGDTLLTQVIAFYHEEREGVLLLLCALFRVMEDEGHPYHASVRDFARVHRLHGPWVHLLVGQFKAICAHTVPETVLNHASLNACDWASQELREQQGFLHLFFLIFYAKTPVNVETSVELLSFLLSASFQLGSRQPNAALLDEQGTELAVHITHLSSILFIEMLNLEELLNDDFVFAQNVTPISMASLCHCPASVMSLMKIAWDGMVAVRYPFQGLALFAWAIFTQRIENLLSDSEGSDLPAPFQQLYDMLIISSGEKYTPQVILRYSYIELQALQYLVQLLKSSIMDDASHALGYKSILKGLFDLLCRTVELDGLPSRHLLVDAFVHLIHQSPELSAQFWSQSSHPILELTLGTFPRDMQLLHVIDGVVGDEGCALAAFQYLSELHITDASGHRYHSGWHYILASLVAWSEDIHSLPLSYVLIGVQLLSTMLKQLQGSPSHVLDFLLHFSTWRGEGILFQETLCALISQILHHALSLPVVASTSSQALEFQSAQELIVVCCSCFQVLFTGVCPKLVWKYVTHHSLLPRFSTTILPREKAVGRYDVTMAFLQLGSTLASGCLNAAESVDSTSTKGSEGVQKRDQHLIETYLAANTPAKKLKLQSELGGVAQLRALELHILQSADQSHILSLQDHFMDRFLELVHLMFQYCSAWKYESLIDRYKLSVLITDLYGAILTSHGSANALQTFVATASVGDGNSVATSTTSSSHVALLHRLKGLWSALIKAASVTDVPVSFYRLRRLEDAQIVESSILSSLQVIMICLQVNAISLDAMTWPQFVEKLSSEGLAYPYNQRIPYVIVETFTIMAVRAPQVAHFQNPVGVVHHLLRLLDLSETVLVSPRDQVDEEEGVVATNCPDLSVAILNLVTAWCQHNHMLCDYFLTGRMVGGKKDVTSTSQVKKGMQFGMTMLLQRISTYAQSFESSPRMLWACYRLFNTLYSHHQAYDRPSEDSALASVRASERLWLSSQDLLDLPHTRPEQLACKAQVASLLAHEYFLEHVAARNAPGAVNAELEKYVHGMLGKSLSFLGEFPFDPELTESLSQSVDLTLARHFIWDETFALRDFGEDYIYMLPTQSSASSEVKEQLIQLNQNWSLVDAYLAYLKAFTMMAQVAVDRISIDTAQSLLTKLLNVLSTTAPSDLPIMQSYRSILRAPLVPLMQRWFKGHDTSFKSNAKSATALCQVVRQLLDCRRIDTCAEYFYGIMLLLDSISDVELLDAVTMAVVNAFQRRHGREASVSASELLVSSSSSSVSSLDQVMLLTMVRLIQHVNYPCPRWICILIKGNFIADLIRFFVVLDSISDGVAGPLDDVEVEVYHVFLALSDHPRAAEQMALDGIMTALTHLCSSDVSSSDTHTDRRWCGILSIVSNLTLHLAHSETFMQQVHGFSAVYRENILDLFRSMGVQVQPSGETISYDWEGMDSRTRSPHPTSVSPGQFLRLERLVLFLVTMEDRTYEAECSALLSVLVALLSQPNELRRRVVYEGTGEADENQKDAKQEYYRKVSKLIFNVVIELLNYLIFSSRAEAILFDGWSGPASVAPTLATHHTQSASLGTLFDIIAFVVGGDPTFWHEATHSGKFTSATTTNNWKESAAFVVESALLLLFSQLSLMRSRIPLDSVQEFWMEGRKCIRDVEAFYERYRLPTGEFIQKMNVFCKSLVQPDQSMGGMYS